MALQFATWIAID